MPIIAIGEQWQYYSI